MQAGNQRSDIACFVVRTEEGAEYRERTVFGTAVLELVVGEGQAHPCVWWADWAGRWMGRVRWLVSTSWEGRAPKSGWLGERSSGAATKQNAIATQPRQRRAPQAKDR